MLKKVVAGVVLSTAMFSAGVMANSVMFNDVPSDAWYSSGAMFANEAGLMTGVSKGVFAPDQNVNRAQLAVILERFDAYMEMKMEMMMNGEMMEEEMEPKMMTIAEIVMADGNFDTLLAALVAADLADVLDGEDKYTVFAPSDAAFAALPEGALVALLADKEKLMQVLLYHVVPGKVLASQVITMDSAETAQGSDVSIVVEDGKVMVNNARVLQTDILASNGVIHVIDSVLMPTE